MEEIDVRFHGICTHSSATEIDGSPFQRVVLLRCNQTEPAPDPHRALLSVPPSTRVDPGCECIQRVEVDPADGDVHYQLEGVHLTMPGQVGELLLDELWDCGMPRLSDMDRRLGPISPRKARQDPPEEVSAWFDIRAGIPTPYVSQKGAVAVRLLAAFMGPSQIVANCWQCPGTRWVFTFVNEAKVRVSNDCGAVGTKSDFLLHYQLAEHPPLNPPDLDHLPKCLLPNPPFQNDAPPGWHKWNNASLGCSNSDYP